MAASCSSHVTEPDLRGVLAAVARDGRRALPIITARGADPDHPTLPGFPEGRYLKLLVAAVKNEPIPHRADRGGAHTHRTGQAPPR